MTTKTYQDFDLLIEKAGDHYRARVVAAPGGQASVEFAWPFSELEVENLVLRLGQTRRGVRRLDSPEMASVKTLLIGAGDMGSSQRYYFNGLIDEVEIFGRALSAAEVQSIYAAGATSRCRTER